MITAVFFFLMLQPNIKAKRHKDIKDKTIEGM